jgi:acetyl-CoA synthetase
MTYAVPSHASAGSRSPLATLDDWRRHWLDAFADPSGYWLRIARDVIPWRTPPTIGLEGDFHSVRQAPIRWFADGRLNVNDAAVDRHAAAQPDKVALIWEGDEPGDVRRLTYAQLKDAVCRCANGLIALGVQPGDRVIIYMGMVPEAAVAMLATARIGAVHSVVFGGFSAESLRGRIEDSGARVVLTQDAGRRGGKRIALKETVDEAVRGLPIDAIVVYARTGETVAMAPGRDHRWADVVDTASPHHVSEAFPAEHPLFTLYTSGSTGKPKGLLHTTGGYLAYAAWTCRTTFDLRDDDIYACVADVGWVTGHSYIVYGPLCNGATSLMFESIPTYPDAGRYWDVVARHRVSIFYTAPTALRALAAFGDEPVRRHDRSSLRVLGTVGEPINPGAWEWYFHTVGEGRCAVVDTWWQTETGGHCISPIAPATPTKPGSATLPLPGIVPVIFDAADRMLYGPAEGRLCLAVPWPGQARTIYGDHERFVNTYFGVVPGFYFTGDGCRRDEDGYTWITGRVDDVINVAGHRMGTAEFESALVTHPAVAESAVVGFPHDVKGQGVWAYVVLTAGTALDEALQADLNRTVRAVIGAHARVVRFQAVPGLPKTRSGKVMRRILRKVAEGHPEQLGDVSTLADPSVVEAIVRGAARG